MSNKIKVISSKNKQVSSPLLPTLVMYLLYDKFPNPQWLWGIVGFLLFLWFGIYVYSLNRYEEVDIFEEIENLKRS